jgi:hypothetical protein
MSDDSILAQTSHYRLRAHRDPAGFVALDLERRDLDLCRWESVERLTTTPAAMVAAGAPLLGPSALVPVTHDLFVRVIQPRGLLLPCVVGPLQRPGAIWGCEGGLVCPYIRWGEPEQWLRWYTVPGVRLDLGRPEVAAALGLTRGSDV